MCYNISFRRFIVPPCCMPFRLRGFPIQYLNCKSTCNNWSRVFCQIQLTCVMNHFLQNHVSFPFFPSFSLFISLLSILSLTPINHYQCLTFFFQLVFISLVLAFAKSVIMVVRWCLAFHTGDLDLNPWCQICQYGGKLVSCLPCKDGMSSKRNFFFRFDN